VRGHRDVDATACPGKHLYPLLNPVALEPLPEDETAEDAATLAQKCRWWLEEYARQRETGHTARADAIMYSLVKLFYRLENALK
jgi:hypothetical protein